jgi:hypothetical protein
MRKSTIRLAESAECGLVEQVQAKLPATSRSFRSQDPGHDPALSEATLPCFHSEVRVVRIRKLEACRKYQTQ